MSNNTNFDDKFKAVVAELIDSSESETEAVVKITEEEAKQEINMCNVLKNLNRTKRNSIQNYLNNVVPRYTEEEFRRHFRISRYLFNSLVEKFSESESYRNLRADKRLGASEYIAVFLWFAGHEACSFRDLSDRFNISLSTVSKIIEKTTMFISGLSPEIIKWPTEAKKEDSANVFAAKCGIPKVIGCIDGTHIIIDPQQKCKDDYIDRKGNISLTMQAVCDERKKFIDVFLGFPGSSHDAWVFNNSPLHQNLESYCGGYYLLGDAAYPCSPQLMTPYRDNGHLTRAQKNFNIKLSSGRVCIEHTFGILKQRFRQLYYCKLRGVRKLCHFIRACCVLHNIADEEDLDFLEIQDENEDYELSSQPYERSTGDAIRDDICRQLQPN